MKYLIIWAFLIVCAQAQDGDLTESSSWSAPFEDLGPNIIGIFLIIFIAHVLLYSSLATRSLMQQYLTEATPVLGQALSSEERGNRILVEVVYEASEHKYADSPSLRFRYPDALEQKRFLRIFEFRRHVPRGQSIEVLIPVQNGTRSGCPTEVVERILSEFSMKRTLIIIGIASIALAAVLGVSIYQIILMEQPLGGFIALAVAIGVSELLSLLYCGDIFLRSKRLRFDSALPVVDTLQRMEADRVAATQQTKIGRAHV